MRLHILVEDTKEEGRFGSEHGLCIFFKEDGKKFLLDLGQSDMFLKNAAMLGIGLADLDYLVFSHGHYDHTGGMPFLTMNKKLRIIAHPHCMLPRFGRNGYIGFPQHTDNLIVELMQEPVKLTEHVWFLGQVPGERRTGQGYYIEDSIRTEDPFLDDTALAIGKEEIVILCGCAHSGIVNIVKHAVKQLGSKRIYIVGGFHLYNHSDEEISETINELKRFDVAGVYPGHCTGSKAIGALLGTFGGERLHSGKVIEVGKD